MQRNPSTQFNRVKFDSNSSQKIDPRSSFLIQPLRIAVLTLDSLYSSYALKNLISILKTRVELVVCTERINNKKYGSFLTQAKKIILKSGFRFFLYLNFYVFIYRFLVYAAWLLRWLMQKRRKIFAISWLAQRYNFRVVKTPDINDAKIIRLLKKYKINLILSIHLDQLVGKELLSIPKYGAVNLHYGKLPQNAGPFPTIWNILRNHKKAAVTLHYMNESFDKGAILAKEELDINENNSVLSLDCRLMKLGAQMLKGVVLHIENGTQKSVPQDSCQFRYRSYPTKRKLALLRKRKFRLVDSHDLTHFFL